MTKYRWIFVSFSYPIIRTIIRKTKEVLYLRWNERHLRTYFEALMTYCKVNDFYYKRCVFARQTLLLKYVKL